VEGVEGLSRWETLARSAAAPDCHRCEGSGFAYHRLCDCAERGIYRACLKRYLMCRYRSQHSCSKTFLARGQARSGQASWSRPIEEYAADFELVARRVLGEAGYRRWRRHEIDGEPWTKSTLGRVHLYQWLYRAQGELGRAFACIEPYPLYPVEHYFSATDRGPREPGPGIALARRRPAPLRAPLAPAEVVELEVKGDDVPRVLAARAA
jgi:hypothetical protein